MHKSGLEQTGLDLPSPKQTRRDADSTNGNGIVSNASAGVKPIEVSRTLECGEEVKGKNVLTSRQKAENVFLMKADCLKCWKLQKTGGADACG